MRKWLFLPASLIFQQKKSVNPVDTIEFWMESDELRQEWWEFTLLEELSD